MTCLSDVEAMTVQEEIFGLGSGASDSTILRALDELAERVGVGGLPRQRLARYPTAWRRSWLGTGSCPRRRSQGSDPTRYRVW
ncbi:MAG: hypothetical protein M3319_07955 [Actinomycetota bacterium]|nr:hypothetical protein [Actinomycetota bacterium]MDQ3900365.1 hypothetical protein [Actinomycetota bacterium]